MANRTDQLLVRAFDIPRVRIVDLQPHILDLVFTPNLHFSISNQHQRQRNLIENRLETRNAHLLVEGLVADGFGQVSQTAI